MISAAEFRRVVENLVDCGYQRDIDRFERDRGPVDADEFAAEVIYVICNSGMKYVVARGIYRRCMDALEAGKPVASVFHHPGKAEAIEMVWRDRAEMLTGYLAAEDKLAYCASLPWIGKITKHHLAKNLGADTSKPDLHLQRLADLWQTTPLALCEALAKETGYRVGTVDTLLWRACILGVIDSRTGEVRLQKWTEAQRAAAMEPRR